MILYVKYKIWKNESPFRDAIPDTTSRRPKKGRKLPEELEVHPAGAGVWGLGFRV
jgi:hypothetical protein